MEIECDNLAKIIAKEEEFLVNMDTVILGRGKHIFDSKHLHGIDITFNLVLEAMNPSSMVRKISIGEDKHVSRMACVIYFDHNKK